MYSTAQLLAKVNETLAQQNYDIHPEGLYQPIKYILSLGGKRIRPVLTLMAYNIFDENFTKEILLPAIGLETFHNYTLLHDDVMDAADKRRGKPTVHKVWNANTAILSGDAMFVKAYQLLGECPKNVFQQVITHFSQTALEICEGQQYDMDFEERNDVKEEEYIEMIRLKTAVLLAASLKIGAIIAGATDKQSDLLYKFGEYIGLAFQLQDDYLDVYGDTSKFGKNIGGDICSNKKTFMLIKALETSKGSEHEELLEWINKKEFNPEEKVQAVTRIYNNVGIDKICKKRMQEYYNLAMKNLENLEVEASKKEILIKLAKDLMYREL